MSDLRDLRTLRERVEEAFKRAGYPSQLEVARRMFRTEGVAEPKADRGSRASDREMTKDDTCDRLGNR